MDYIDKIIALRQDNDITQATMAAVLGIQQSAYSKYERRRSKMQIDDIIKICRYLNVSADYILNTYPIDQ